MVTVGTFDGVHRGHQLVLDHLVARARARSCASLLVTFHPHPLDIVNPAAAPSLLTTHEEKLEALAATGVQYVAVLPFTPELMRLEPREFVGDILLRRFRMQHLLMGYDHGFGRDRAGNVELLQRLGRRWGFDVEVVPPVALDHGGTVSSTGIRRALVAGDLDAASSMLGRPYSLSGPVTHGAGRGRLLGFPTVNVQLPAARKLLPPLGVYSVRVQTRDGSFGGMMNLGPRPTFGGSEIGAEVHVLDTGGDWYGSHVRIDLVAFLRATRTFSSPEALVSQLEHDARAARETLHARPADRVDSLPGAR